MQNPVKICKIENIPFFKYFDHKDHFIKDSYPSPFLK
jgi:hypothetical protein